MSKETKILFILFILGSLSSACPERGRSGSTNERFSKNMTKSQSGSSTLTAMKPQHPCSLKWQKSVFPTLNKILISSGIKPLAESKTDAETIEIRVWVGFGIVNLRGVILRKSSDSFKALYLNEDPDRNSFVISELNPGNLNYESFIQQLQSLGLLQIPDECELIYKREPEEDADSIVIEVRMGDNYRAIMYENPGNDKSASPESKKLLEMSKLIEFNFSVDLLD